MSIQHSELADPKLIAAIDRIADSINRLTALMFPVVKNCGTCRFFDRKNLLDGICFVNGKENVKRRRVTETPCEKHEDFFESEVEKMSFDILFELKKHAFPAGNKTDKTDEEGGEESEVEE